MGGQPPRADNRAIKKSRFKRSRKVLFIKVLLPLIAVGLIGVVLAWPQLQTEDEDFRLEATSAITDANSTRPQVLNPRLSGVDEDGQPFEITADIGTAATGESGEEIYYLTKPKADISLNGGAWLALSAADGVYESAGEVLILRKGVSLFHDSGVEFQTESARILMADKSAEGDDPVHGFGDFGEIRSQGFRILDRGDKIVFTGRTDLLLTGRGSTLLAGGASDSSR
jgi:lipopolysaccharide export system protein LptC